MKRFIPLILIILLLTGCQSEPNPPSISESSQTQSPLEPIEVSPSSEGTIDPEKVYDVFEDLVTYAELREQNLDILIGGADISIRFIERVKTEGLSNTRELSWDIESLVNYAWGVYTREKGLNPTEPATEKEYFEALKYAYADPAIESLLKNSNRYYNAETKTFAGKSIDNYGYMGQLLKIETLETGDSRTYVVRFYNNAETMHLEGTIEYDFIKGEDGRYRYLESRVTPNIDYDINITGDITEITMEEYIFDGIVGGIGDRTISAEFWDGNLNLYSFVPEKINEAIKMTLPLSEDYDEPEGSFMGAFIKGENLHLYFRDRIIVLGSDFNVLYDEPLPEEILTLWNRVVPIIPGTDIRNVAAFGGYDFSEGFTNIVYSTELGLFQYDISTAESTILVERSKLNDGYRSDLIYSPKYNTDQTGIFTQLAGYEGVSNYAYYDIATGNFKDLYNASQEELLSYKPSSNLSFGYSDENYLYITPQHIIKTSGEFNSSNGDISYSYKLMRANIETPQQFETILEMSNLNELHIRPMPDGRVIIRYGKAYIGDVRYAIVS